MERTEYLYVDTVNDEVVAVHGKPLFGSVEDLAKDQSTFDKVFFFVSRLFGAEDQRPTFFPAPSTKIWDYLNDWGHRGWVLVESRGENPRSYVLKRHKSVNA